MDAASSLDTLRPAGGKRSSKREFIVNVFLRHEGHLSADDLVELIHREDERISRATIYRALQWMLDAGIARKVDFGDGRFRFEHSYRHPRHFHLICKTCNRSFEFLSSDIDALVEEIATARNFTAEQSVLQIYGTCEECRTGRPAVADTGTAELLFARDALRIAIATERSGLEFYARAAAAARVPRVKAVFQRLADEERRHLDRLEARYQALLGADPQTRVAADVPLLQGSRQWALRGGHGPGGTRCGRPAGPDDRDPLRADLAQVLQAVRRAVRGLGGQADLPGIRAGGAGPSRPAGPRAPADGARRHGPAARAPPHGARWRMNGAPRPGGG